MYNKYFKRAFDVLVSAAALLILSPIYALIAILVRVKLGSPIIFVQQRPGKDGKVFRLYKFRTMTDARDENGVLLADEFRMTRFGEMLREMSLDELPELWNILRGDMSLVGPRPLLTEYLELYNERQMHRHDVRPGLTGWAQVNGRNTLSWEEKFELDVEYVEQVSFIKDIKIILMTVGNVLRREGINSETAVTMERFQGTKAPQQIEK